MLFDTPLLKEVLYCLVAWEDTPLAHYSSYVGTFVQFCQLVLTTIDRKRKYATYKHEDFFIHCYVSKGYTFLCLTHNNFPQDFAFNFLHEVKSKFMSDVEDDFDKRTPVRYELNKAFGPTLQALMHQYRIVQNEEDLFVRIDIIPEEFRGATTIIPLRLPYNRARRLKKIPLIVQTREDPSTHGAYRDRNQSINPSSWLLKHPFLMIGFCIFIALALLFYFVIVVPVCGKDLQNRDANGKRICLQWIHR